MTALSQQKILIIKLSALGDFIQNLGIMRAIRDHHPDAHLTLLTTAPYVQLAEKSGYFDKILIDSRPKFWQLGQWLKLKNLLNKECFSCVYDLQINDRTALYYKLFTKKPDWIGTLKKESRDKSGFALHRHKKMIESIGIKNITLDKMEWMDTDLSKFKLQEKYALIVPGCAPTRPEKRWPAVHYITLCQQLLKNNIQPVLIGTKDEGCLLDYIEEFCHGSLNLKHQTSLFDIAPLARNALLAIGNDTGPMHIIGPTGCHTLTLFSKHSDPQKHAPLGSNIYTIQKDNIEDILPELILEKIENTFSN
jgi:ADP-heptose:LPS heptosyltransferase